MTELRQDPTNALADGTWIPLMDYAMKKGISLSTLRRHIKANKVRHKIENGRYMLLDELEKPQPPAGATFAEHQEMQKTVQQLTQELKRAREEVAELKTLIALYEEKIPHKLDN